MYTGFYAFEILHFWMNSSEIQSPISMYGYSGFRGNFQIPGAIIQPLLYAAFIFAITGLKGGLLGFVYFALPVVVCAVSASALGEDLPNRKDKTEESKNSQLL